MKVDNLAILLAVSTDTSMPANKAEMAKSWGSRSVEVQQAYMTRAKRLLKSWSTLQKSNVQPKETEKSHA